MKAFRLFNYFQFLLKYNYYFTFVAFLWIHHVLIRFDNFKIINLCKYCPKFILERNFITFIK